MTPKEISEYIRESFPEWKQDKETIRYINLTTEYKNTKVILKINKQIKEINIKFIGLAANDYRKIDYLRFKVKWLKQINELFI